MFIHLLKQDLKYLIKPLLFYLVAIFISAGAFALTAYDTTYKVHESGTEVIIHASGFVQFLHTFFQNAAFALGIGLVITVATRFWYYFKQNIYGDPAYLTHTLPVRRTTIWSAKFCALILISLLSLGGIILAIFISGQASGFFNLGALQNPEDNTFLFYLTLFCGALLQLIFTTLCGVTGIIVGQRSPKHSGMQVIIAGVACYFLGAILMVSGLGIWSLFNPAINDYIFTNQLAPTMNFMTSLLAFISLLYFIFIVVLYFIDRKLLTKINID